MFKKLSPVSLAVVVLSIFILSIPAQAGEPIGNNTLIKKLIEKGVLSKEEAKEISSSYPKVKLGGRVQVQYRNHGGATDAKKANEFFMRRARFTIDAQLSETVFAKLNPFFDKGSVGLKDAYIGFHTGGGKVTLGNQYVPFSREALTSSKYLQFVERNLTSQLAPFRQMGVLFQGNGIDKKFAYKAGIFNGSLNSSKVDIAGKKIKKNQIYHIELDKNDNNALMYGGRLEYHPFGFLKMSQENFKGETKLALGTSYYASDDTAKAGATADTAKGSNAINFDADLRLGNLSALAEYTARKIDYYDSTLATGDSSQKSYSLQGSYMVTPKFAVAARYEFLDYDDTDSGLTGNDGQLEDIWTTIRVSYYFQKHHTKIQANYVTKDEKMPAGGVKPKNDTLLIQTAWYF